MTCNPNSEKEGPAAVSAPPGALPPSVSPSDVSALLHVSVEECRRKALIKRREGGRRRASPSSPPSLRARLTPGKEGGREAENLCPENCPLYPVANETLSPHFSPSSPLPLISLLLYLFYPPSFLLRRKLCSSASLGPSFTFRPRDSSLPLLLRLHLHRSRSIILI